MALKEGENTKEVQGSLKLTHVGEVARSLSREFRSTMTIMMLIIELVLGSLVDRCISKRSNYTLVNTVHNLEKALYPSYCSLLVNWY